MNPWMQDWVYERPERAHSFKKGVKSMLFEYFMKYLIACGIGFNIILIFIVIDCIM